MGNTKTYEWDNGRWVEVKPSRFSRLSSLDQSAPEDYEKRVASLYTQTQVVSNDFMNMLNTTKPFMVDGTSNKFAWTPPQPVEYPITPEECFQKPVEAIDFTNDRIIVL